MFHKTLPSGQWHTQSSYNSRLYKAYTFMSIYVAVLDLYLNGTCIYYIYFSQRVLRFHADIIATVGFQLDRSCRVFNQ